MVKYRGDMTLLCRHDLLKVRHTCFIVETCPNSSTNKTYAFLLVNDRTLASRFPYTLTQNMIIRLFLALLQATPIFEIEKLISDYNI